MQPTSPSHRPSKAAALLPVALLLGVYLLVALVIAACVVVATWVVLHARAASAAKILIACAVLVFALLSGVYASLRKVHAGPPEGVALTPAEQPQLWALITELAQAVGTRPPDEVRLVAEANAEIREDFSWLGLRGGKRNMSVGAPYLLGLTIGQLRSILGHELGHYSGQHTRFASLTVRGALALDRVCERTQGSLISPLFRAYGRLYFRLTARQRRAQEAQADRISVMVNGREQAVSGLHRVPAISAAWDLLLDQYAPLAVEAACTPDLFEGYSALLGEGARAGFYQQVTAAKLAAPTQPYATHPALGERVALAMAQPDVRVPLDNRPAWSVVSHLPQALRSLQVTFIRADLGPAATWERIAEVAGRRSVHESAAAFARVAQDQGWPATVGAFLDALARGQGADLVRPLVNPGVAPQDRAEAFGTVLTTMLTRAAESVLLESDRARCALSWAGPAPWVLVGLDATPISVRSVIAPAVSALLAAAGDPAAIERLRGELTAAGVDLRRPIRAAEVDPLRPELLAVALAVTVDGRKADLLVGSTGVVVAPMTTKQRMLVMNTSGWSRGKVNRKRLKPLLDRPLDEVSQTPGNRFIGTHEITSGSVATKLMKYHYDLVLRDGSAVKILIPGDGDQVGRPWEEMARLLGARLQPA